jgi:hypothetical protein
MSSVGPRHLSGLRWKLVSTISACSLLGSGCYRDKEPPRLWLKGAYINRKSSFERGLEADIYVCFSRPILDEELSPIGGPGTWWALSYTITTSAGYKNDGWAESHDELQKGLLSPAGDCTWVTDEHMLQPRGPRHSVTSSEQILRPGTVTLHVQLRQRGLDDSETWNSSHWRVVDSGVHEGL